MGLELLRFTQEILFTAYTYAFYEKGLKFCQMEYILSKKGTRQQYYFTPEVTAAGKKER